MPTQNESVIQQSQVTRLTNNYSNVQLGDFNKPLLHASEVLDQIEKQYSNITDKVAALNRVYEAQQRYRDASLKSTSDYLEAQKELSNIELERLEAAGATTEEYEKQLKIVEDQQKELEKVKKLEEIEKKRKAAEEKRNSKFVRGMNADKTVKEWALDKLKGTVESKAAEAEKKSVGDNSNSFAKAGLQILENLGNLINNALKALSQTFSSAITDAKSMLMTYQAQMDSRLEGTSKNFKQMSTMVTKNLGLSPIAKQTDVLKNINKAVSDGIAYNVEQRAYLKTVSDNIVMTFDALSQELDRMIRLQGTDSTVARMGMEADLQKMLGSMYEGTQYLSQAFDSVTTALFETSARLGNEAGMEFEYTVQKWLGALFSSGMSTQGVTEIANALNKLGTGDVQGLAGNSQMQTLLAMSANRAGLDYAKMMTEGIDASNTNKLLASMVSYLAEIANSTTQNNVVANAYGNILGMSLSDLKSITNVLSTSEELYNTTLSYTDAEATTVNRVQNLSSRMNYMSKFNNVLENATYGVASQIVNHWPLYLMYQLGDTLLKDVKLGPVDLGAALKGGTMLMAGAKGLFGLGSGDAGWGNPLGTNLNEWGAKETITRGDYTLTTNTSGTSSSKVIGNASSSDTLGGVFDAYQASKDISEETPGLEGADVADIYNGLFDVNNPTGVLSAVATDVNALAESVIALNEKLIKTIDESTINVKLNGIDTGIGMPIYFSNTGGSGGYVQLQSAIAEALVKSFGLNPESSKLQDLISLITETTGGSAAGLNVNLTGNEVSATSFLTGNSTFERY